MAPSPGHGDKRCWQNTSSSDVSASWGVLAGQKSPSGCPPLPAASPGSRVSLPATGREVLLSTLTGHTEPPTPVAGPAIPDGHKGWSCHSV